MVKPLLSEKHGHPIFRLSLVRFSLSLLGLRDAFITKISQDGSGIMYSSYLGSDDDDIGYATCIGDNLGLVYMTGWT